MLDVRIKIKKKKERKNRITRQDSTWEPHSLKYFREQLLYILGDWHVSFLGQWDGVNKVKRSKCCQMVWWFRKPPDYHKEIFLSINMACACMSMLQIDWVPLTYKNDGYNYIYIYIYIYMEVCLWCDMLQYIYIYICVCVCVVTLGHQCPSRSLFII